MKRVYCHETFLVQSILGCKIMTIIPVKHIFCRKKNSSWKHTIYSHLLWYCGQWLTPCSVNHYTYIQFSMSVSPVWKRITLFLFSESKVKQIIPIFSVHPQSHSTIMYICCLRHPYLPISTGLSILLWGFPISSITMYYFFLKPLPPAPSFALVPPRLCLGSVLDSKWKTCLSPEFGMITKTSFKAF